MGMPSQRFALLTEECGSLTGNQWVGGPNPGQFANHFNELAPPD
jgi:hypothetical protein